jgi:peptidoglycan/LPS O-acetylase OafA/YrhL
MRTLQTALIRSNGTSPGADTLRLSLAIGVIVYHSFGMTGNVIPGLPEHTAAELGRDVLVPMFIGLSGFLLAPSAIKGDLWRFAFNRALRIFPALVALALITAFVVGPAFTTLPLAEYLTDRRFWRYLLVSVSWISFDLPEVFVDLPATRVVNPSLWSIPVELQCYAVMMGMMVLRVFRHRSWVLVFFAAVLFVTLSPTVMGGQSGLHFHISRFMSQFPYFLTGVVLYLYRDLVPRHIGLLWGAVSFASIILLTGWNTVLLPIAVTYCAIYLATAELPPRRGWTGDYSYGVYLYGGLVQQMVLYIMPQPYAWWLNVTLAVPISLACAITSWHLIEKPALRLKSRVGRRPSPGHSAEKALGPVSNDA